MSMQMLLLRWHTGENRAASLQRALGELLADRIPTLDTPADAGLALDDWRPSLDLAETEEEFESVLPGIDARDVEVSLVGHALTIWGEIRPEAAATGIPASRNGVDPGG